MDIASVAASLDHDLLDADWEEQERVTYSSEDELLSPAEVEGEEAAAWLIEVGLQDIVTTLLENGSLVTETTLANAARDEGLTNHQYHTVRKRVETLKATLKGRKTKTSTTQQSRPDCRDIFRDPEVNNHSEGSSGRSRSATPESLKNSTENLISITPPASPKVWSRKGSHDNRDLPLTPLENTPHMDSDDAFRPLPGATTKDRINKLLMRPRMRHEGDSPNVRRDARVKPTRPRSFFIPTSEGHVAATDKQGIEIVKYKPVDLLSGTINRNRSNSDPLNEDILKVLPKIQLPRISLEDGLTPNQRRKLRQLALLELTALMDNHGLVVRKRRRLQVMRINYQQSNRERQVFGVPLKKLTDKDQTRVPVIFSMILDELKKNHLKEDGLLRVSGNKSKTNTLQKLIEAQWKGNVDSKNITIVRNAFEQAGAHELGNLLKLFLRLLPESIFTQDCVDLFAQVGDIHNNLEDQLKALNLLTIQLPDPNCQTLRSLLRFLADISDQSAANRMTTSNIATVMGPNLFPPRISKGSKNTANAFTEEMAYTEKTNGVTHLLLTHQSELFTIPKDILLQLSKMKVK